MYFKISNNRREVHQQFKMELNVPAQQTQKIQFDNVPDIFIPEEEYIVEVRMIQRNETLLVPKGYEVSWNQFILNEGARHVAALPHKIASQIGTSGEDIQIQNDKTDCRINSKTGEFISWAFEGKKITNQPIRPSFWRLLTDNDLGNGMDKWAKIWQDASYSYSAKLIGKPAKTQEGVSFSVGYILPNAEADFKVDYEILANGILYIDYHFKQNQKELPNISKLGMYLTLPNSYADISWYGNGPMESYWDRKIRVKASIYSGKVA